MGFSRSTVADARFQAAFPHQDGASFAIAVQQRRPGDVSAERAPFALSSLGNPAVRGLSFHCGPTPESRKVVGKIFEVRRRGTVLDRGCVKTLRLCTPNRGLVR